MRRSKLPLGASTPNGPPPDSGGFSRPLAAWQTDVELNIVVIRLLDPELAPVFPPAGNPIPRPSKNAPFLHRRLHRNALLGRSAILTATWHDRRYRVDLSPHYNRKGKIVGVLGMVRQILPRGPMNGTQPRATPKKGSRSSSSGLISMELARTVAQTAIIAADSRMRKAQERRQAAEEALARVEAAERRARLLADASAILDSGPWPGPALERLGALLVPIQADWWVLELRTDNRLRRAALVSSDERIRGTLERLYPSERELSSVDWLSLHQSVLHPHDRAASLSGVGSLDQNAFHRSGFPLTTFLRVPLKLHGRIVGALSLGALTRAESYGLDDLRMAENLGYRIALAEESARLLEEAEREIALRRQAEARVRQFNLELERRVVERTLLLQEASREANSFAYTVAHDLRAPLRAITGFCQVLQEDYSAAIDDTGKEYLKRIVGSAGRMDELIRDLLEYARLNRTEIVLGVVDLDAILMATLRMMSDELARRDATFRPQGVLGKAIGQEVLVAQALRNLLSNAVKFIAPGVKPEVRIWTERRDASIRLCVADNGIGIAPEHRERIFGMFERLNNSEQFPGTGMGLAITKRAMERLGGSVGVASEVGKGSTFWIELPAVHAPPLA